jgi:CubicO group peptidase (beta-lactamase class C family)
MDQNRRSFMLKAATGVAVSMCGDLAIAANNSDSQNVKSSSDTFIERERHTVRETMAQNKVEGVAVCLIRDGKPAWVEGFGITDAASGRAVDTATIFSIQSTSKNFTAVAIMLAVQQGLLDLDAPITRFLPGFVVRSRFESSPQERITLRLLLSHRAGFTHEAPVGNNYDPAFPSFDAHVRSISDTWLRFPVGERYRYSNLGVDLAGYILQVRTGTPFAEWVKTALFEPLKMADSTFASEVYEGSRNRAVGHFHGYASVPLRTPLIPSGGLYTSARDMTTYAMFHLGQGTIEGKTVLRKELWEEMHGFALGGDYGLGVIRSEVRYGTTPLRIFGHKGGGFGFGSVFVYCPEARLAWAVFFNRSSGGYGLGENLVDGELAHRYGPRRPRLEAGQLAPIELTPLQLHQFIGNYIARNTSADITRESGALVKHENDLASNMSFTSPTEAFIVDSDREIVSYRYYPASTKEPAHLECSIGEDSLDFNHGPDDPAGPDKAEWDRYLGKYVVDQWGIASLDVTIQRLNGYLALNGIRLIVESNPGLFFTADGEAVDFRGNDFTWKNLRLVRQ